VHANGSWSLDAGRTRAPGRGTYLCSQRCAVRALKNKRYAGLGTVAAALAWESALREERGRV